MKIVEVVDQFSNQPITREHLYKVQAACSVEFRRYFNMLLDKYPNSAALKLLFDVDIDHKLNSFTSPTRFYDNLKMSKANFALNDINKILKCYTRMLEAKKTYEIKGGKYYERIGNKQ